MSEIELIAVDRLLAEIYPLQSDKWQWSQLASGTSNRLFHTQIGEERYVLRINAPDDVALGCSRYRESLVLPAVSELAVAPGIIRNDTQQGWCLMRWGGDRVQSPLTSYQQTLLLQAVNRYQQLDIRKVDLCIDYPKLLEGYRHVVSCLPIAGMLDYLLQKAEVLLEGLSSLKPVLVHHDLHYGNLCFENDRLTIIDWEYAALGSAWLDLASLHYMLGCSVKQISQLSILQHIEHAEIVRNLEQAQLVNKVLEYTWYWGRGLQGTDLTTESLMKQTMQLVKRFRSE